MITHAARSWSTPLVLLAGLLALSAPARAADDLTTVAERSGWKQTGRYSETQDLCKRFAREFTGKARCFSFGTSPEGRPMMAIAASADGVTEPSLAFDRKRPVVIAQGGIHAGEIDGKDAGFYVLREMLRGKLAPEVLKAVTFVFVPVFNVDGHERFGAWNRPNQRGPEQMGWRVTGQNLNLNRDYLKAEAPEMRAMIRLLNDWDPILYVDLHVTDGAEFQHEVSLSVQPTKRGPAELTAPAIEMRDEVMRKLAKQGWHPLSVYPEFNKEDDPASGIDDGVSPPRFSQAYWGDRNRIGVLVETHSWKDYATRVRVTRDSLVGLLQSAAVNGKSWVMHAREADAATAKLAGTSVALTFEKTGKLTEMDFLGYEYKREASAVSGALMTTYDPTKPQVWKLKIYDELKDQLVVKTPLGGYVVPPAQAALVADKLKLHGIAYSRIDAATKAAAVEAFRATSTEYSKSSYEGRTRLTVKGAWSEEKREILAGSLFVPIAQAKARLILHLLEPQAPDSLVSWGFLNSHFEQREYMEPYVAEMFARDLMGKDPKVRAAFDKKLGEDAEFAQSPEKRLDYFYRLSPSWDERYNLYPILKVAKKP